MWGKAVVCAEEMARLMAKNALRIMVIHLHLIYILKGKKLSLTKQNLDTEGGGGRYERQARGVERETNMERN